MLILTSWEILLMDFQGLIWRKFVRKQPNLQLEMLLKPKQEWKLWLRKVERLSILIQSLKSQESISKRLSEVLENQSPIWIWKSLNSSEESLTQVSPINPEEDQAVNLARLSSGLHPQAPVSPVSRLMTMMTSTVDSHKWKYIHFTIKYAFLRKCFNHL